jgi:hypothetical protein
VKDGFNTLVRPSTDATVRGQPLDAPASTLVPSLQDTHSLDGVQNRFENDFNILKPQITDLPHLSESQKASRAFDFFAQYANRFVQIAKGEDPKDGKGAEALEILLGPEHAEELATSKPVTDMADADGEFARGQGKQNPEGAKGKEDLGKLGRLLENLLQSEEPEPKSTKQPEKHTEARPGNGKLLEGLNQNGDSAHALQEGQLPPEMADALMEKLEQMQRFQQGLGKGGLPHNEVEKQAKSFAELLRAMNFGSMKELFSGKDGVQFAYELLMSGSLEKFQQMLKQKEMVAEQPQQRPHQDPKEAQLPPPEHYHPATMGKEVIVRDLGGPEPERHFEFDRMTNQQDRGRLQPWQTEGGKVIISAAEREKQELKLPWGEGIAVFGEMGRKLGSNQLWNILHQFRAEGEDSAVEKEKFDQLAFAAIMLLALLMMIVMALVAL